MDRLIFFHGATPEVIPVGQERWTKFLNTDRVGWISMRTTPLRMSHSGGIYSKDKVELAVTLSVGMRVWDRDHLIQAVAGGATEHEQHLADLALRSLQIACAQYEFDSMPTALSLIAGGVFNVLSLAWQLGNPFEIQSVSVESLTPTEQGRKARAFRLQEQSDDHALEKAQLVHEFALAEGQNAIELARLLLRHKILRLEGGRFLLEPAMQHEMDMKMLDTEGRKAIAQILSNTPYPAFNGRSGGRRRRRSWGRVMPRVLDLDE